MPIIPTSTSPISLPFSSINRPGIFSGSIGEKEKQIFTILSEQGRSALFQNPIGDAISGFDSNVNRLLTAYNNSPCFGEAGPSESVISAISGAEGLTSAIESFTLHTNTLSGLVAQTGNNPTPGLERVLAVGKSINDLNYAMYGASGCLNFLNNMTGLFSGELIQGYASQITDLINRVNMCLASANEIISIVNEMKNQLQAIIDADNNFFENALETLRRYALSSIVDSIYGDPCGKFLMENKIAGPKLRKILSP